MRRPPNRAASIDRRTFLTTGAVLAGSALVPGSASARQESATPAAAPDVREGDRLEVGDGTVTTYAINATENLVASLGVHLSEAAIGAFDEELAADLGFPAETAAGHPLELGQFTFVRFEYTRGHWPDGTDDVPHFDVHFFMIDRPTVAEIEARPASYEIPAAQLPDGHVRSPAVDTDDDGEPDAPLVESERGEPIVNPNASEFREAGEFTHTHIYGASDPDRDGVGRLVLFEPMIAVEFADELDALVQAEIATPTEFFAADRYPTRYVVQPTSDGGVYLYLDGFEEFSGPGG